MNSVLLEAGFILLLLVGNGVFAMTELAVVSARKSRLKGMAAAGDQRAAAALALAESPNRFLSTVQVGITMVGILAGAFGGATLAAHIGNGLAAVGLPGAYAQAAGVAVVVVVITFCSLIVGELVPKRVALANPEGIARVMAGPMARLAALAWPLVKVLSVTTELVLRLLGLRERKESPVTEEEVRALIREGREAGVFHQTEARMVEGVLALDRLPVREIMTPRAKIIWINVHEAHETIWHKVVVSGHTTFPVYQGDRDNVVGMISVKAIYANLAAGLPVTVKDLMTKPLIVPSSLAAISLLETFKRSGQFHALVSDEFGGIVGLVSLHDVMEAVIGDFPSQDMRLKPMAKRREDGSWLVDAMIEIEDFQAQMPQFVLPPPEARSYHTFGGYVFEQLGRVPAEGDAFEAQGYRIEIIDMDRNRVDKVLLIPLDRLPPRQS
ncbi:MAG: HlyC/CorC family transporter [Verrucomicrobia bacterium]|jgi:putative hemolysin|nr:HlyC/CorC family transporter [Verrucomicrobiota bacterium]